MYLRRIVRRLFYKITVIHQTSSEEHLTQIQLIVKMNILNAVTCFLTCFLSLSITIEARGVNGGIKCAACTIVTGLAEQLSYLNSETLVASVGRLCRRVFVKHPSVCTELTQDLEPLLSNKDFMEIFTPDVFCYAIGSCYKEEKQNYCHLFPRPLHSFHDTVTRLNLMTEDLNSKKSLRKLYPKTFVGSEGEGFNFCLLPVVKDICDVFLETVKTLRPAEDADGDGHSVVPWARGADWRGRDCDDLDPAVHPGVKPIDYDKYRDSNCNGIYGIDPVSRIPWEQKLCPTKVGSRGLIYIGDSFGAHFHFPRTWMDPRMVDSVKPDVVTGAVLDELDWPEVSYATGFAGTLPPQLSLTRGKVVQSVVDSIYMRMRARNRCNHRDYANLSQNGAAARDFSYVVRDALVRNRTADKPALVLYAFMGNDVCNRFQDTVGNMTPPAEFRANVMSTLEVLQKNLPRHSQIVLVGLLDGDFIYPEMANKVHPIGSVLGNVHYKDVYDWFTCMEIGPCNGWMTANATLRRITSEWSRSLNAVLEDIASTVNYACCKLHYIDSPAGKAVDSWRKRGRKVSDLIEAVDSVHPNQFAQSVIADELWEAIFEELPRDVVGPLNPSNARIKRLFGDQGGH